MKASLAQILATPILDYRALSGGDISAIYWVKTTQQELAVKINDEQHLPDLLAAEARGLRALAATDTIKLPFVHDYQKKGTQSFLVMDYIPQRTAQPTDFEQLAIKLAQLHQQTAPYFGAAAPNYLGSLRQSNAPANDWPTFYVQERLVPQIKLAVDQGLLDSPPSEELLLRLCADLLGSPSPSPLHGDLWGGNYLIAENGNPYLIDPSFYYGHSEVDIAMSHLFGGFDPVFYQTYQAIIPATAGEEARRDLYQLYYLLAHLNMFGLSYQNSVVRILRQYFS